MLDMPPEIRSAGLASLPLDYPWNSDISDRMIYAEEDRLPRLQRAWWACDPRTGYALALATAEWTVWRYEGIVDLTDAAWRLEAGYAAVDEPARARIPTPSEPFPATQRNAHGPLKLARMLVTRAHVAHVRGDTSVHAIGFSLALLALHVCAASPALERWMEHVLRRCHAGGLPVSSHGDAGDVRAFFFAGAVLPPPTADNPYLATP